MNAGHFLYREPIFTKADSICLTPEGLASGQDFTARNLDQL
ncbi:hypothetical protein MGWOODY_Mmi1503 [hydrothermal vent metagenome]|uniref:Uncharacterized protein n=1 Tax=hydrothermal vent metagenome TaxID=652676 RepID=A0A161K8K8_9ZZZZ